MSAAVRQLELALAAGGAKAPRRAPEGGSATAGRAAPVPGRLLPVPGPPERVATGLAALDAALGGGLPRGQITEVCGGPSSGKATLAQGACLRVLESGGTAVWIDAGAGYSPLAALEAGVPADRLLVVRVPGDAAALRAADILLGASGAVDLAVVDLIGQTSVSEGRTARFQRQAERSGAALVVLSVRPAGAPALGALVALRLRVRRRDEGEVPRLEVEVVRNRRGPATRALLVPAHGPDRLRVDSTL